MKRVICIFLAATALTSVACDDGAKKAEEMKAAALASASAATAAAAASASAAADKVKETQKAAVDSKKGDLKKQITDGLAALDRKATSFKEKAAKLPGPVKLKADEAFKKYDAAKAALTGMTASIDGVSDIAGMGDMATKVTGGLGDATKALGAFEEIVTKGK
jgi:flagellar hook-associated protein FlgK